MELPVKTGPLPVQNTLGTKMNQNTPWEFWSFPLPAITILNIETLVLKLNIFKIPGMLDIYNMLID